MVFSEVLVELTSFLEADARWRGVNQPWSLALTLAPEERQQTLHEMIRLNTEVVFIPYA